MTLTVGGGSNTGSTGGMQLVTNLLSFCPFLHSWNI